MSRNINRRNKDTPPSSHIPQRGFNPTTEIETLICGEVNGWQVPRSDPAYQCEQPFIANPALIYVRDRRLNFSSPDALASTLRFQALYRRHLGGKATVWGIEIVASGALVDDGKREIVRGETSETRWM